MFGSHALDAMKQLAWPAICIPPKTQLSPIRKIALACDFENVSGTVPLHEIEHLAKDFQADLHVLNIGRDPLHPSALSGAGFMLRHMCACHPQFHFIQQVDVDEGMLDFVQHQGVDLLIVLPKRNRILDALVHRSHTRQFVLHSLVPLMAMHVTQFVKKNG